MTDQERIRVGEYWLGLAQMYGKDITRTALKIMLDAVSDLPTPELLVALEDWSKTSKINRHPLPAELRETLKKELSIESKANEAANRIRLAITRFGWPDPTAAKVYMGDLAWAIVERSGGWQYICENHGLVLSPTTFHAQARDSAKAILESASLGQFNQPIAIGQGASRSASLTKGADVIKMIGKPEVVK